MKRGDAFVAEVAVDFINSFQAAGDQALQIKFGGDPQIQILIQRVVMCFERPGDGAAGFRLHHGGFHFQKIVPVHELPDQPDDQAAPDEDFLHRRVGDQIQMPLAVAGFDVRQTVPLFRQGANGFGRQAHRLGLQRQLVGLGPEKLSGNINNIANVQLFKDGKILLAEDVFGNVALQLAFPVLDFDKSRLAEAADGHQASGERKFLCELCQTIAVHTAVFLKDPVGCILRFCVVGVQVRPGCFQCRNFFQTNL